LSLAKRALRQTGHDAKLGHRPYMVLAQCSRRLGAFDAALGNLTRASELASSQDADDIAQLVATVRREKDAWDHDLLQRQGFAGFRAPFSNTKRSSAEAAAAAAAAAGSRYGAAGESWQHPAFAAAGASSGKWAYSDWSKAKWEEEFRAAYERMSNDSPGSRSRASPHKFPWEQDAQTREAPAPHPDPFAPPGGAGGRRAQTEGTRPSFFRPGAGSSVGGTPGSAKQRGLYSVLQIDSSATGPVIKKAYMKLVPLRLPPPPSCLLTSCLFLLQLTSGALLHGNAPTHPPTHTHTHTQTHTHARTHTHRRSSSTPISTRARTSRALRCCAALLSRLFVCSCLCSCLCLASQN
jgi:hypothetical protein